MFCPISSSESSKEKSPNCSIFSWPLSLLPSVSIQNNKVMSPILLQSLCQISRIIRESLRYRLNPPVSHMDHQISHTIQRKVHKIHFSDILCQFLAFGRKIFWIFDAFLWLNWWSSMLNNFYFRVKKVKLVITRISIFVGWHRCKLSHLTNTKLQSKLLLDNVGQLRFTLIM